MLDAGPHQGHPPTHLKGSVDALECGRFDNACRREQEDPRAVCNSYVHELRLQL
jgi:hypothetical protein